MAKGTEEGDAAGPAGGAGGASAANLDATRQQADGVGKRAGQSRVGSLESSGDDGGCETRSRDRPTRHQAPRLARSRRVDRELSRGDEAGDSRRDVRIAFIPAASRRLTERCRNCSMQWPNLKHVELDGRSMPLPGGCRILTAQGEIDADLDASARSDGGAICCRIAQ